MANCGGESDVWQFVSALYGRSSSVELLQSAWKVPMYEGERLIKCTTSGQITSFFNGDNNKDVRCFTSLSTSCK